MDFSSSVVVPVNTNNVSICEFLPNIISVSILSPTIKVRLSRMFHSLFINSNAYLFGFEIGPITVCAALTIVDVVANAPGRMHDSKLSYASKLVHINGTPSLSDYYMQKLICITYFLVGQR
jgi:hypothetical protein